MPGTLNQLHITNWYPNPFQRHEAPFIREHFEALPAGDRKELWHVQVRTEGARFRLHRGSQGGQEHYLLLDTPIETWRTIELLHLALLASMRADLGKRWWDVVVVHIAYPLLRFTNTFKRLFGDEIVIVEHWSAFHSGFQLAEGSAGRRRIQNVFRQGIPVIAVSKALLDDIARFADIDPFPGCLVPNVVDTALFQPPGTTQENHQPVFLMVGNWAPIKRPLLAFEGFAAALSTFPGAELRVVGYGAQMDAMKDWVRSRGLEERIRFLGATDKAGVAAELRNADALVHPSDYETFSVVCAEAAACGTPVIASCVGGIPEFIDEHNGILVGNETDAWIAAIQDFCDRRDAWDRSAIAHGARERFSSKIVGAQLDSVLRRYARTA